MKKSKEMKRVTRTVKGGDSFIISHLKQQDAAAQKMY